MGSVGFGTSWKGQAWRGRLGTARSGLDRFGRQGSAGEAILIAYAAGVARRAVARQDEARKGKSLARQARQAWCGGRGTACQGVAGVEG